MIVRVVVGTFLLTLGVSTISKGSIEDDGDFVDRGVFLVMLALIVFLAP